MEHCRLRMFYGPIEPTIAENCILLAMIDDGAHCARGVYWARINFISSDTAIRSRKPIQIQVDLVRIERGAQFHTTVNSSGAFLCVLDWIMYLAIHWATRGKKTRKERSSYRAHKTALFAENSKASNAGRQTRPARPNAASFI